MVEERTDVYSVRDIPLTLLGAELKVGAKAPGFSLISNAMQPVSLADSKGKTRIIAPVVSLDTGVCDQESKKFNEMASQLPKVEIIVVSKDLPFAQKRWCGANNVENIQTLSAYRDDSTFGLDFGIQVKETRLLARSIFVVDADDIVQYTQYIPNLLDLPDFDSVAAAAKKASGS
jgi:thiol peroxidase